MKRVCIIGVGLIGGSIGIDARRLHLAEEVVGVVRRKESIEETVRLGAVDSATLDIAEGTKGADLVILATPISNMISIAEKIRSQAIIIDVASVKGRLARKLESILGANYVGTHPMAGSEKRGVSSAKGGLFDGATCIVTPTENTNSGVLEKVIGFWKGLGSKVITLSVDEHDRLVALTSHLPHMLASSLVNTIADQPEAGCCFGPGFKDTTRIASSPPALWQEICEWNRDAILDSFKKFRREISEIEKLIDSGSWDKLLDKLIKAKEIRDKWK